MPMFLMCIQLILARLQVMFAYDHFLFDSAKVNIATNDEYECVDIRLRVRFKPYLYCLHDIKHIFIQILVISFVIQI
jgi:hypothetical protein